MSESPQDRAGGAAQRSGAKTGFISKLLDWIVPEGLQELNGSSLPSSLASLRKLRLVQLKCFGVLIVRCSEPLDSNEASTDVYDHPWSFLRIRLTGSASELYMDRAMSVYNRRVRRIQLVRADEFVGLPVSKNQAWLLLFRGIATKRAGRLGNMQDGQAAYVEEVPWEERPSSRSSKIVVDD